MIDKNKKTETEYLKSAANMVEKQMKENPEIGIPVDPDVADFMGAFEETAVTLNDIIEADGEDGFN